MRSTVCGATSNIMQASVACHFAMFFIDFMPTMIAWAYTRNRFNRQKSKAILEISNDSLDMFGEEWLIERTRDSTLLSMIKLEGVEGKYLRLGDSINDMLTAMIDNMGSTEQLEFVRLKNVNFLGEQNALTLFKDVLLHERLGVNLKYLLI